MRAARTGSSLCLRVALATLGAFAATGTSAAGLVDVVEFYHANFDHYFVTASADEIGKLDAGVFVGWRRTGQGFKVYDPTTTGTAANPVCRFYGNPAAGLDSHFYSASPAECDEVKRKYPGAWILEADAVFQVRLPNATSGACPAGSVPVYRSWNARADSNHRYTTDLATQQAMIANGYVAEGYGPTPVAMCSPQTPPGTVPTCQIQASSTAPQVGTLLTLIGSCTGNPTAFAWTNCASVTSACTAAAAGGGPQTYTLIATNVAGPSAPASITVNWIAPPPPEQPPVCSVNVTAQSETPIVGSAAMLVAACTNNPTSFGWTGCNGTINRCRVQAGAPGVVGYTVTAFNSGGAGSAQAAINWVATPAPPSGQCGSFPSALYSSVGDASTSVYSSYYTDAPGFAWNGAWAVKFTIPSSAGAGQFGSLQVAEFGGPPTFREVSVSRSACDFRTTDLSGNAGPLGRTSGSSATLAYRIGANSSGTTGLAAGQTYYVNVRNYVPGSGTISCTSAQTRCDAITTINIPR